jgi:surface carbohydrate biosynthesis protein (TIGR04326 family)
VIWDERGDPPRGSGEVLCWRSYAHGDAVFSVPRYLEAHAPSIRQKYLAFIHDLGECRVAGKRIIDHLDMGDDFSLWWMTQVAEKSPLKSPRIYDCLRLIALEEILIEKSPSAITLVSSDKPLAQAVHRLCRNLKIGFRWRRTSRAKIAWSLRRMYETLPVSIRGLISLRHILKLWRLRALEKPRWFSGKDAIFIGSYFIHLDPTLCAQGQFYSRQWGELPKILHNEGRPTNWIQLFMFSKVVPSVATGASWVRRFNRDACNQGCHTFLESYLTLGNLLRVLKKWVWLNTVYWRLRDIESIFYPNGSAVWLWPMLRSDWQLSLNGPVAISSCLSIVLFDVALADMPRQEIGLYLCENQAWEKALLRAWRRHGHGEIIGVQHATVPFWHLYYFDDPRSLTSRNNCALPLPDRLAANGAVAWEAFAGTGYPTEGLIEVEALRYQDLEGFIATRQPDSRPYEVANSSGLIKAIILGDMISSSMHHLLTMVETTILMYLPAGYSFTLKSHPGYSVDLAEYPGLKADETSDALGRILGEFDVAIAANSTSASVDAYLAGLPVIIGLDGDELNLSPLRGQAGVRFVSSCEELAEALQATKSGVARVPSKSAEFFFLNPGLARWKRLLAQSSLS